MMHQRTRHDRGFTRHVSAVLARMNEERISFTRLRGEPAARGASTAFMEKRKPDFGRF
jgi:hypothetical protein